MSLREGNRWLKPKTLEVPDNVRREIERLQERVLEAEGVALSLSGQYEQVKQRAERAEAKAEIEANDLKTLLALSETARERAEADLEKANHQRHEMLDVAERAEAERDELNRLWRKTHADRDRAEVALRLWLIAEKDRAPGWRQRLCEARAEARAIVEGKP